MISFLKDRRLRSRGLCPIFDGTQRKWVDPFVVYRGLASGPVKLPEIAEAVDAGKEPETTLAVQTIAAAFGVQRWNGNAGLTDTEILGLITQLDEYVDGAKKKRSPGQT